MPSRSLKPSQTSVSIHLGTHILPSLRKASTGETSVSHRRLSFLRYMNGFWKGFAPRSKKLLTNGRILPQVSSPSESVPTLASKPSPDPPYLTFSPLSPTLQTPASLPCHDVDPDGWPWFAVSGATKAGDYVPVQVQHMHHDLSRARSVEPRRTHASLSENSGLSCMASTSPTVGATSASILDAATRLQDFRSLIVEMRASLLDHDRETVADAGECDEEEIERLLLLLEDVMRRVRGLSERDIALPLIKIHAAP